MESMILWHERDLTNSSAERFILTHSITLTDDILNKINNVFSHIEVHTYNMQRNIGSSNGFIMAESVLLTLSSKGIGRQNAHELVRQISIKAEGEGKSLREALLESDEVMALVTESELDAALDPNSYVGSAPQMVDRIVADAEKLLGKRIV